LGNAVLIVTASVTPGLDHERITTILRKPLHVDGATGQPTLKLRAKQCPGLLAISTLAGVRMAACAQQAIMPTATIDLGPYRCKSCFV